MDDSYQLIATILWAGLALSILALIAGLVMAGSGRRKGALAVLFVAVLLLLTFSFFSGFSIGGFTVIVPVLISGFVIGMGRGSRTVGLCLVGAAIVYVLFSWVLTPLGFTSDVLAFVFGFWAIPVYTVAAAVAFSWALLRPPRPERTPTP